MLHFIASIGGAGVLPSAAFIYRLLCHGAIDIISLAHLKWLPSISLAGSGALVGVGLCPLCSTIPEISSNSTLIYVLE